MGRKKKRAAPDPRSRIFCYYCDRTFNNEQELLMHQREKHLRCPTCNKRMLSVPSLTIHSEQMHNKIVSSVPNAIPGRESTQIDVLGMKGVPEEYYLALEGKSAKKTAYQENTYQSYPQQTYASQGYQTQAYPQYQGYTGHSYQPHQYPAQPYASQPYASQPYAHNYQQHPQHYAYPTQGYPNQNRAHHGYSYPSQYAYPAQGYQSHHSMYAQQPYGPKQPVTHSQPQHTPVYSAPQSTYAQPTTATHSQPPTNVPRPVPDEKPPSLPAVEKETPSAKTEDPKPAPVAATPVAKHVPPSEPGITIIFDRTDMSMEEMRAQLPRYRVVSSSS